MLSGSRRGDRRVPAMWISARAPKLGWCWDGNPHDWLGVASAGSPGRLTPVGPDAGEPASTAGSPRPGGEVAGLTSEPR